MDLNFMNVLILGASLNPTRYSYLALNDLIDYGHNVHAIGRKAGVLRGIKIADEFQEIDDLDTVTLYLGPRNQAPYLEYLKRLKPRRVIFNPGTENDTFQCELESVGIEVLEACTLVMLRTNQF